MRCARRLCSGVRFDDGGANGDATAAATAAGSCLLARVPWLTPHAQVHCCYRCCLVFWTARLGLMAHFEHWRTTKFEGLDDGIDDKLKKYGMPLIDEARGRDLTDLSTFMQSSLEKVVAHVSAPKSSSITCGFCFWRLVRRPPPARGGGGEGGCTGAPLAHLGAAHRGGRQHWCHKAHFRIRVVARRVRRPRGGARA